jgi:MFS family permease
LDGFLLFGGAFPFLGSFLVQEFGLTAAEAGLAVAGFGLGSFVYTRIARRLVTRFGEKGLVLIGGFGLAVGLVAVAVAPGWPLVVAAQVLMGLVFFMFHGVLQARATEALPEARGTAVAFFAMSLFLGQSLGSLAFGLAIAAFGFRPGFAIAGVAIVALAIWTRLVLLRMPAVPAAKGQA